ncbi:hypothetical protein CCH79_00017650, partial [Gambusia affinis]
LTAQRSIEDAEEVERERRRKARESLRRRNSGSTPEESSPETEAQEERNTYDRELKPSRSPSLEEDEGFSDWTQLREKQRQERLLELSQDGEEEEEGENVFMKNNVAKKAAHAASMPFSPVQRQDQEDTDSIRMKAERRNEYEEEVGRVKERGELKKNKVLLSTKQETQRPNTEEVRKKELKVSYTSKIFLCQKPKHNSQKSGTADQEVTSVMNQKNRSSRQSVESEEAKPFLEAEQRLERIRQSLQEKESQELEQIRYRQLEAEQELEELKRRREERRRAREEEERQREDGEKQQLAAEEVLKAEQEERRKMKEDMERRRMEAAERMKILSMSSAEGEEVFSPKVSPHKITERTNSLNRLLKKRPFTQSGWSNDGEIPLGFPDCQLDVRSGGVLQKKNMWEIFGDPSGRTEPKAKPTPHGKKHKFIVTGHGKYEKISVDECGDLSQS